ncbi:MAG: sensor histidine kinase [Thermoleophilia bacterium]
MSGLTNSLKGRFAVYFALGITFSLLVSTLISVGLVQRYLKQKTINDLKGQAQSLSSQIESDGLPTRRYINDLEKVNETRAIILPYGAGQVLSRLPGPGGQSDQVQPSTRPLQFVDWELIKTGGVQVTETKLPGADQDVIVVARGFNLSGELAGAVVLAKPLGSLQSWVPLTGWFLVAAAVSLAVSLLLAIVMARRLSRPLHEITLAASAVAAGDFSRQLTVESQDEIGRLADAFRYMSDEVQKSQDQQRQFVINVSHELKTPLTAITGHARALQDGVATDPADVTKSIEIISSETGRLSRLIEDLLSLAKFDARQFELKSATVALRETLDTVANGFAMQAGERGVELKVEGPAALTVTTDPDRLGQVLANLVQNALAHTPSGGRVTITARGAGNGRVAIDVADTGEGIGAEDLPHVFDRFFRAGGHASGAGLGLGLGLAISRELTRAMGGDITARSRAGSGSTFTVALPS